MVTANPVPNDSAGGTCALDDDGFRLSSNVKQTEMQHSLRRVDRLTYFSLRDSFRTRVMGENTYSSAVRFPVTMST